MGTSVNISHVAASPLGATVTAEARLTAVDKGGRQLSFELEARDDKELVGSGSHQRFVVVADKFMAKAQSKLQG